MHTWPDCVRFPKIHEYKTIYEYDDRFKDEQKLFGTETLFGDWDAEVLFLAQDFGPTKLIDDRIARGERNPFRHTCWIHDKRPNTKGHPVPRDGGPTNRTLYRLAQNITCKKLYGSCLIGLMRTSDTNTGPLKNPDKAIEYGRDVLSKFVYPKIARTLRAVFCLGEDSWECLSPRYNRYATKHKEILGSKIYWNGVPAFGLRHPGRGIRPEEILPSGQKAASDLSLWKTACLSSGLKWESKTVSRADERLNCACPKAGM